MAGPRNNSKTYYSNGVSRPRCSCALCTIMSFVRTHTHECAKTDRRMQLNVEIFVPKCKWGMLRLHAIRVRAIFHLAVFVCVLHLKAVGRWRDFSTSQSCVESEQRAESPKRGFSFCLYRRNATHVFSFPKTHSKLISTASM